MKGNKHIERDGQEATKIFDNRSLDVDYRHLKDILKEGMQVLDVGCGTGAISKDIAQIVGAQGKVVGIDNTEKFIASGKSTYQNIQNLELIPIDLFQYHSDEKYDLIIAARVLQWLSDPKSALIKMKSLLKSEGMISILDYNHDDLEWEPAPPESMQLFYATFLRWRADAGMDNKMGDHLEELMHDIGLKDIQVINSDEYYIRSRPDFISKVGVWSQVAGSTQMVEEGYLDNDLRLLAIEEYNNWVQKEAVSMTMNLKEVRGFIGS